MKIRLTIFALTGLDGQNGQAARHLVAREPVSNSELASVSKIFFKNQFSTEQELKNDFVKHDECQENYYFL